MPLRALPYRTVERKLLAVGFTETSQKGSHVKFTRLLPEGLRTVIVPSHRRPAVWRWQRRFTGSVFIALAGKLALDSRG